MLTAQLNLQVEVLTKKHHIYLTKDGRISMAGEDDRNGARCSTNMERTHWRFRPCCFNQVNECLTHWAAANPAGLNEAGCEYLAKAIKDAVETA